METTMTQPQMGLTFEQVWAALMKVSNEQEKHEELMREQMRKTDEQMRKHEELMREQMRETDEQIRETNKQLKEMFARVDRVTANVGGLNRSMGELIETLIAARLWEKFDGYPYNLQRAYQRVNLFDETNRKLTDIDILLANGDYVMAVEVKRELDKKDDVDHHLRRMDLIRQYPPAECKGKKLLGAMAGGTVDSDVQEYAHSVGFFVLELTGESVELAERPAGFAPREW
jgi:predicted RNase H-like nuclease (RuvC/YqgF family)